MASNQSSVNALLNALQRYLQRVDIDALMTHYDIPDFSSPFKNPRGRGAFESEPHLTRGNMTVREWRSPMLRTRERAEAVARHIKEKFGLDAHAKTVEGTDFVGATLPVLRIEITFTSLKHMQRLTEKVEKAAQEMKPATTISVSQMSLALPFERDSSLGKQ